MKENEDILKRAVEALKSEQIPEGPPKKLTDATMAKLAEVSGGPDGVTSAGRVRLAERLRAAKGLARVAAAAVLLIAAGYAGRLSVPPPDAEQLQATLEPAIRQALLAEMKDYLQLGLTNSYAQLRDELSEQFRRDLGQVATQTLVASGAVTNRLLEDLIESINAAQIQDRQWMTAALEQIESNRLQDQSQLSNALVSFAVRTEDELLRNRQNMAELFSYTRPESPVEEQSDK
jgi:tellurite resistance protein